VKDEKHDFPSLLWIVSAGIFILPQKGITK